MRTIAGLVAGVLGVFLSAQAQAGLDLTAYESQLEAWLGEGDLTFTNIFTKTTGSTSFDFHAAADGKGRTFTLIELLGTQGNTAATVGGYNPQSWDSSNDYHYTTTDAERTAFLYNLDAGVIQRQNLGGGANSPGWYQTANYSFFGPVFGGGYDIFVDGTLNAGYAYNYSYGGTVFATNIYQNASFTGGDYGQFEVYTVSPAAVPEPGTLTLLGIGSLGITALGRYRRKSIAV